MQTIPQSSVDSHRSVTRVLIVDDSAVVRERLEALLTAAAGIRVVGHAAGVSEALEAIEQSHPDAVVLDLGLQDGSGIEVLEHARAGQPRPAVIVLTNYPLDEYRERCMALGASAFLDKSSEFDQVMPALLAAPAVTAAVAPRETAPPVRLDRVLSTNPAVMFVLRIQRDSMMPVWVTPNIERVTGYRPDQAMSPTWHRERVHPDDVGRLDKTLRQLFQDGAASWRYRFRHSNGKWIWLHDELRVERDSKGIPTEVIGAMLNVTERQSAKRALADRERRYRSLAEAISDSIVVLEDSIIREITRPFTELYGYSESDIIGRSVFDFIAPESREQTAVSFALDAEETYEIQLLTKDGGRRTVSVTPRVHRSGGRKFRLVALHDLTTRRQLERQFQQAQKMDAIGRLAGSVAHDFNNVLTVIGNCVELAAESLAANHAAREDLTTALGAVTQGATLAKQLLSFSRPQIDGPAFCDVNAVLEEDDHLLHMLMGSSVEYRKSFASVLPLAAIDCGQLRQAVMNLVINARDAMPQGGTLTIATAALTLTTDVAPTLKPGRYVQLLVRDTGSGMSAEVRSRIFEPFFTTKQPKGTGLGLASVYGLVSHAGGGVSVQSELGHGAQFEIFLPVAADPSGTVAA